MGQPSQAVQLEFVMQSKPHLQTKGIAVLGIPAWFVGKGSKAVVQCPGIVTVV